MFKDFLHNSLAGQVKQYNNYMGISKEKYPRWLGWKLINSYKGMNIHITEINDKDLDLLVYNFYYLKWIESNY